MLLAIVAIGGADARALGAFRQDPPPITTVRYSEDYSYLRDADAGQKDALAPWTRLKYVPLGESGAVYFTFGLELRLRYERLANDNWGQGAQERNGYLWTRALPLVDLHVGEHVRLFAQAISAFVAGQDLALRGIDENRLDVLQAFLELTSPLGAESGAKVTARLGRQLMTFGSGRLIDLRYGPNVLLAFDAVRAFVETGRWRLDALYARPVDHQAGVFDDGVGRGRSLWSVYGTVAPIEEHLGIDLYYVGFQSDEAEYEQGRGRELRHTLGSRIFGDARGWDWNVELFYQFGAFGSPPEPGPISAWSVATDTGHTWSDGPLQPRLSLRADLISGDRDARAPRLQTFNALFPKGRYFGELTPLGPANLVHLQPSLRLNVARGTQVGGSVGLHWRQSEGEGIYALGAPGLVRASGASRARYVGTQLELLVESQLGRHLSLLASLSAFTAGPFIEETGAHRLMHFAALEAMYRF